MRPALQSGDSAGKIKRPAVTYSLEQRGDEWRVKHGNKVVQRFVGNDAEDRALSHLKTVLRSPT